MINLIPDDLKTERLYGRRNRLLFGYGASLLLTAGVTASIMFVSLGFVGSGEEKLKSDIATLTEQNLLLEQHQQDVENLVKDLDAVNKLYESNVKFSELIPNIASLLPKGTVLNALSLTGGRTDPLQLDVDLETQNLAATLIQNLVSSELFEAADISSIISKGGTDNKSGYSFGATITVSFRGSAEAKRKEKAAEEAKVKAAEEAAANPDAAAGGTQ